MCCFALLDLTVLAITTTQNKNYCTTTFVFVEHSVALQHDLGLVFLQNLTHRGTENGVFILIKLEMYIGEIRQVYKKLDIYTQEE